MQYPANYWYMLPQANQARKAIWTAVDSHTGMKRIDWAFPEEIRESTNDQEMLIRFKGGSTWQVVGSDNYQGVIGSGAFGIVYSEYMLSDPNAWLYLSPILEENGGWAIFNGTPRGRNHFQGLYELGLTEPGWFSELLTVKHTGALNDVQIETIRRQIAKERGDDEAANIINQEYYCSWDAAIPGSYYGKLIAALEAEDCIGNVAYDPRYPVVTGWDIGVGDSTAIWFAQRTRTSTKFIDCSDQASGRSAPTITRRSSARNRMRTITIYCRSTLTIVSGAITPVAALMSSRAWGCDRSAFCRGQVLRTGSTPSASSCMVRDLTESAASEASTLCASTKRRGTTA